MSEIRTVELYSIPTKEHHVGKADCIDTCDCSTFFASTRSTIIEELLLALIKFLRPDHVLLTADHAIFPGGRTVTEM